MRVGFIGLGKLGRPVASAIHSRGHSVVGYDISPQARALAAQEGIRVVHDLDDLVANRDLVFVAVQTPHEPLYEGVTRLPAERIDFDYTYLQSAIQGVAAAIQRSGSSTVVAVISTVLPGTMDRLIKPMLGHIPLVYNPSFIAMGTVVTDYLGPEFVLLGVDDLNAADLVEDFYYTITEAPIYRTSVRNAELIKVAYNTYISMKIVYANTLMEICHKTGCDVDAVTGAMKVATKRLVSPMYMDAGMGDGGACHPRDNIALSWLAREVDLSYDLFESVMMAREKHAEWLANLMCEYDLPKAILGTSYKAGVNIETGSPAMLVKAILEERGEMVWASPYMAPTSPCVCLIGTKEPAYKQVRFVRGSVVLDPWRFIPAQEGVTIIGVGRDGPGIRRSADQPLSVMRVG